MKPIYLTCLNYLYIGAAMLQDDETLAAIKPRMHRESVRR
jgi:hypothetical protein